MGLKWQLMLILQSTKNTVEYTMRSLKKAEKGVYCMKNLGILIGRSDMENKTKQHPFKLGYRANIGRVDWESYAKVLDSREKRKHLMAGWK